MSGFLNRSVSMVDAGGPVSLPGKVGSNGDARHRDSPAASPLKIFVLAKKKINDIFTEIDAYVMESRDFLKGLPPDSSLVTGEQVQDAVTFKSKIAGIREVLSRDHMKVAFFGRTSNGKSTVINAMLQDKILPSGIGHTTNCFLQVEGTDSDEAFLITEDSKEKKNVKVHLLPNTKNKAKSVGQLGHALCSEKLGESALVRIFWPKDKCTLLRDDVVLVDSPGIDVSPNLDEWIDKHCLDADVFVLVANAESTLMVTEKNFFHKVSARLSKPNIFILNNRWDASASEPDFLEMVHKQHLDRNISFLVDELNVVTRQQAEDRVFFVSAKEALQARLQHQKGQPLASGALADGFQVRYFEFENFERKFEECISKSAVETKFEQHVQRGKNICSDLQIIMDHVFEQAWRSREEKEIGHKEMSDQLDFTEKQLALLTHEVKDKINQMVEEVEQKVANALNEEIRRLSVLVDEFSNSFHPDLLVLNVYKKELNAHVELGLGSNLRSRLSTALSLSMESTQKDMTERMSALLPVERKHQTLNVLPRRDFEVLYRLNCDNLCADFQEDIEFRFSLGITCLINRFMGHHGGKLSILGYPDSVPRPLPATPLTPMPAERSLVSSEELSWLSRFAIASVSSQGAVGIIVLGGVLMRAIGWRVFILTGSIYGVLYVYERLTWTNKAKERAFKRQYVQHATRKLRLIVDLTSANCSHQVQQELSSTFARLCHLVDEAKQEMAVEICHLEKEVCKLEERANFAKKLRNKAGYVISELDTFARHYLLHKE
uniref:Dynamin-type G domain-containing protein n=1 Tax=Strigamia maritima TaxID=126957 RepID=T1JMD1_STRMM